jgi:hypothetical protein
MHVTFVFRAVTCTVAQGALFIVYEAVTLCHCCCASLGAFVTERSVVSIILSCMQIENPVDILPLLGYCRTVHNRLLGVGEPWANQSQVTFCPTIAVTRVE